MHYLASELSNTAQPYRTLPKLRPLELSDTSLSVPSLSLGSLELLLLLLANGIADPGLPVGVHNILLLLGCLKCLLEPVLRLGDLPVNVDAALDVEVHGGGCADGVYGASSGGGVSG
jgi:hypothetical protein